MKNIIVRLAMLCAIVACGVTTSPAQMLVSSVTNSGYTYLQNFDSLPTQSGTLATTNVWLNNSTLTGWYVNASNAAAPAVFGFSGNCTNIIGASGSSTLGAFFSFGTNGAGPLSDRAIGSIMANSYSASGTPGLAWGIRFTNDTSVAMTNFTISYTGEQWRNNGNASAQTLTFGYRVDSTAIVNADVGSASAWTLVPGLNFSSPIATASAAALDGNASANRVGLTNTITGLVLLPGQEIFFRWLDLNDSGNDHALAIDDVKIVFTNTIASATAPTITTAPTNTVPKAGSQVFASASASGTQPIFYFWFTIESGVTNYIGNQNNQLLYPYALSNMVGNQFYVVASNSVGVVTSATVAITGITGVTPIATNIGYVRKLRTASYAVADPTNLFTLEGVVLTPNLLTYPLESYFIWDGTNGVDVFNRDGGFPMPSQGDRVRVTGPLFNFNGLLELNLTNANPTHTFVNISSGNALPSPTRFDFATAGNPTVMEDSIEGSLVFVTNVFLTYTNGPFFAASSTIFMTNATGKGFQISIPQNSIGDMVNKSLQSPPFAATVIGIISQNSSANVPTNNYVLSVDTYANIVWTNNVNIDTPITLSGKGTNQVISWPLKVMNLYSATNVEGPYEIITGASNPYTNDATTNAAQFFKLGY